MYLNEADVGPALQRWLAGGHSRAELWVTSKARRPGPTRAAPRSTDAAAPLTAQVDKANVEAGAIEAAARASIAKLGVEYLDLYLIHSPFSSRALQPETWSAMESLVARAAIPPPRAPSLATAAAHTRRGGRHARACRTRASCARSA